MVGHEISFLDNKGEMDIIDVLDDILRRRDEARLQRLEVVVMKAYERPIVVIWDDRLGFVDGIERELVFRCDRSIKVYVQQSTVQVVDVRDLQEIPDGQENDVTWERVVDSALDWIDEGRTSDGTG
jgi:hypothetical protein